MQNVCVFTMRCKVSAKPESTLFNVKNDENNLKDLWGQVIENYIFHYLFWPIFSYIHFTCIQLISVSQLFLHCGQKVFFSCCLNSNIGLLFFWLIAWSRVQFLTPTWTNLHTHRFTEYQTKYFHSAGVRWGFCNNNKKNGVWGSLYSVQSLVLQWWMQIHTEQQV